MYLRHCTRKKGGSIVPESSLCQIFHDVLSGTFNIILYDIVHYDIKLSNILFFNDESVGCLCKTRDFSLTGGIGSIEARQEGDVCLYLWNCFHQELTSPV